MITSYKAELWPLQYDALRKGDVIPAEAIERYASAAFAKRVVRGTDDFGLACMQLVGLILDHRAELRARRDGHDIRILTDVEYAADTQRRLRAGVKKVLRTATLPSPELRALSQSQRDEWDRSQARSMRHAESAAAREQDLRREQRILTAGAKRGLTP